MGILVHDKSDALTNSGFYYSTNVYISNAIDRLNYFNRIKSLGNDRYKLLKYDVVYRDTYCEIDLGNIIRVITANSFKNLFYNGEGSVTPYRHLVFFTATADISFSSSSTSVSGYTVTRRSETSYVSNKLKSGRTYLGFIENLGNNNLEYYSTHFKVNNS